MERFGIRIDEGVGGEEVPETSKQGTWFLGQLVKGAQVSSPFVMAVALTRMRCSSWGLGRGAEVLRLRVLVSVSKMTAFWVWGRVVIVGWERLDFR